MENKKEYEVIFCIVNHGFTDVVMNAAKANGARGGTIITARGTGNQETASFYGITIQPEKEIVMIVAPKEIKDSILTAIYDQTGLETPGQGIAFSLSVSNVVGINTDKNVEI